MDVIAILSIILNIVFAAVLIDLHRHEKIDRDERYERWLRCHYKLDENGKWVVKSEGDMVDSYIIEADRELLRGWND